MLKKMDPDLQKRLDELIKVFESEISNPTEVLEQVSYLLFMKRLEEEDNIMKNQALLEKTEFNSLFSGKMKVNDSEIDASMCKWSSWINMPADSFGNPGILMHVRDKVFPFIRTLDAKSLFYAKFLRNSSFTIEDPALLIKAVKIINSDELKKKDKFTDGLIYNYLLSKLKVESKNKQYKTPEHVIDLMIQLVKPTVDDLICDPTCATGGFLVQAFEHILSENTSSDFIEKDEQGNEFKLKGDLLENSWQKFKSNTFFGFNSSQSMARVALMNLMMHGLDNPNIQQIHTLSSRFAESEKYSLILSNPPFNEELVESEINPDFEISSKKSINLYLELVIRLLSIGGRAAIIVPEGLIFGTRKAETKLKKMLLSDCRVDAIIKMHPKIFQPFGKDVSTSIIVFTKGESTKQILFYEMESDGYTIDKKRNLIDGKGDIPDIIDKFYNRERDDYTDRKGKFFTVKIDEIIENKYDLSFNQYKDFEYETVDYGDPRDLLRDLVSAEENILENAKEIEKIMKAGAK